MANYTVKLSTTPKGHMLPKLLSEVGAFVKSQAHGSVGYFDAMVAEEIPKEWSREQAERLRKVGFAFLQLPDGSLLALLSIDGRTPVVLLGSEGEARTVGESLEDFLTKWSKGETDVDELDDDDGAAGRKALGAWLKEHKVKACKAKPFEFQAWLDGLDAPAAAAPKAAPAGKRSAAENANLQQLPPKLRAAAELIGLRGDDPKLVKYVTTVLKKKVPTTTVNENSEWVEGKQGGLQLLFSHDIHRDEFPPISKGGKSFLPYLSYVDVDAELGEEVLGVPWEANEKQVKAILGEPDLYTTMFTDDDKPTIPTWVRPLGNGVALEVTFRKRLRVTVRLKEALELQGHPSPVLGVFVGWALQRGLLDSSRFPAHQKLVAEVKARKQKGSDLIAAALPRGLWDDHLVDKPALRIHAYRWFHRLKNLAADKDFIAVFGKRKGTKVDVPDLEDDSWEAVDKAQKTLDARFKQWLK